LPSRGDAPNAAGTVVGPAPSPARVPADDRRPCPSCGAGNLASALSCWQCQAPFRQSPSTYGSPGAPAPGWSGRAGLDYRPIPESVTPPRHRPIHTIIGAVLLVLSAAGGFSGFRYLTSSGVDLPQSLVGADRLEIPAIETEIDRFKREVASLGFQGDAAMYGTAGIPSFMVMVVGDSPENGEIEDSFLQAFAEGFSSSGSLQVDLASIDVTQEGDATFRCTRITGGPQVSMCMWVDPGSVGFVFAYLQAVDPTRELTRQIRTSLQA
jgi:hypothetical protein